MDQKTRLYWLSSIEVREYADGIKNDTYPYRLVDIGTQKYVVFPVKDKEVNIAWPTIDNNIYYDVIRTNYFRYCEDSSCLIDKNEMFLCPCMPNIDMESLDQYFFKWYAPDIINYPMKVILSNSSAEELKEEIDELMSSAVNYDYVIVGNHAYVEYVPDWAGKLIEVIPEDYWEVKIYKKQLSDTKR